MLTLNLNRYYGNINETKSILTIYQDQQLLFQCEARELGFKDYIEDRDNLYIAGFCMQRGTFHLSYSSAPNNHVCLRLKGVIHHRGLKIYCDDNTQRKLNAILLGYADSGVSMAQRRLKDIAQCREDFTRILYSHYLEPAILHVINEGIIYDKDPATTYLDMD